MTISQVKSKVPKHLRDEWRTPPDLFYLLNDEFNFGWDAAANGDNTLCRFYFGKHDDALKNDWYAYTAKLGVPPILFMNPPFSQQGVFLAKANEEAKKGATVVCLVRASAPETDWWEDAVLEITESPLDGSSPAPWDPTFWYRTRHEIRYLKPRVQYLLPEWPGDKGRSDFPSCLVIMRPYPVYNTVWWWKWK